MKKAQFTIDDRELYEMMAALSKKYGRKASPSRKAANPPEITREYLYTQLITNKKVIYTHELYESDVLVPGQWKRKKVQMEIVNKWKWDGKKKGITGETVRGGSAWQSTKKVMQTQDEIALTIDYIYQFKDSLEIKAR